MNNFIFRVWDIKLNKMFYSKGINIYEIITDALECEECWLLDIKHIIMLSLGKTDRNNKEIFDGDIIKQKWMGYKTEVGVVSSGDVADDWNFELIPKNCINNFGHLDSAIDSANATVIGNIHDNPELLTPPQKEAL